MGRLVLLCFVFLDVLSFRGRVFCRFDMAVVFSMSIIAYSFVRLVGVCGRGVVGVFGVWGLLELLLFFKLICM